MTKIFIITFLVLVLSSSTFAGSFTDISSDHWAYDAVNKLVASGVITGFPDETFRGQKNLSRYDIAVIVAKVLDKMEAADTALASKINQDDKLSLDERVKVNEIIKSIVNTNTGKELSEQQADEVRSIVQALTLEFGPELKELGVTVDSLVSDVEKLKKDMETLKARPTDNVTISGEIRTIFEYADYGDDVSKEAVAGDPWMPSMLHDHWSKREYDDYIAERALYQELNLDISGNVKSNRFNFSITGLDNELIDTTGKYGGPDDEADGPDLDEATLMYFGKGYRATLGSFPQFVAEDYFIHFRRGDVPKMEGISLNTSVFDANINAFVVGDKGADYDPDWRAGSTYYGLKGSKKFGDVNINAKFYQVSDYKERHDVFDDDYVEDYGYVRFFEVSGDSPLTDNLTVNGRYVSSSAENLLNDDYSANVGLKTTLIDALDVEVEVGQIGEDFIDIESWIFKERDSSYIEMRTKYQINKNNTLFGHLAVSEAGDLREEGPRPVISKNSYINGIERYYDGQIILRSVINDFINTYAIRFKQNDEFVNDKNELRLLFKNEYAINEKNTLTTEIMNNRLSFYDDYKDRSYIYVICGLQHKFTENIDWNTKLHFIDGKDGYVGFHPGMGDLYYVDWDEGRANMIKSEFVYRF